MRFPKRLLDRMKTLINPSRVRGSETFNSGDIVPICLDGKYQTRPRRFAVEQDCAGAAHSMLTANVRASQPEFMAQKITEQ